MDIDVKVYVSQGLVCKPGDRVLITLSGKPADEEAQQMCSALNERFPGVEFTVFANATAVKMESGE